MDDDDEANTMTSPAANGDGTSSLATVVTTDIAAVSEDPVHTTLNELTRKLSNLTPASLEKARAYLDETDGAGSLPTSSKDTSQPQTPSFAKTPGVTETFFRVLSGKRSRPRSAALSRSDSYNSVTSACAADRAVRRISLFHSCNPSGECETKERLFEYVKELAGSHKKTNHLIDVLVNSPWFAVTPNLTWEGGFTVLHAAAAQGETKVVTAIAHIASDSSDHTDHPKNHGEKINLEPMNDNGNTPLHLAAAGNHKDCIETLLKHGAVSLKNKDLLTPLQVAVSFLNQESVETFFKHDCDHTVLTKHDETLINLACRAIYSEHLNIKDKVQASVEAEVSSVDGRSYMSDIEARVKDEEKSLLDRSFPILAILLDRFKKNPDLLEKEDSLPTSPGTTLHYFACLNYVEGVKTILDEPFIVSNNTKNKAGLTPLWLAAYYNYTQLGTVLLDHGAEPNVQDPIVGYYPLHCAIYGYHIDRVEETCEFIDQLLRRGANPHFTNKSGETAPLLAVGTNDFQLISKFLDHLGQEVLNMRDESGNSLFHYAVGCLDELSIYKLMELGANLMARGNTEMPDVAVDAMMDFDHEVDQLCEDLGSNGSGQSPKKVGLFLARQRSNITNKLPVQEAMKNSKSAQRYFNALRRLDLKAYKSRTDEATFHDFVCVHLVCATREVRPDIVRLLFQHVNNTSKLHQTLLYCDPSNQDDTLTKTALEWAVENNDRLCTTEILHQEFECHKNSKHSGLNCLRDQLTGDELLMWTIETFNAFYDKTFAQKYLIPVMGLFPLLLSIATFVYDYYSDTELTIDYHARAFMGNVTAPTAPFASSPTALLPLPPCPHFNDTHFLVPASADECAIFHASMTPFTNDTSIPEGDLCSDFDRTAAEYTIAFYTNIICVGLPMIISYAICVWELKCIIYRNFEGIKDQPLWIKLFLWIGLLLIGVPFAPLFILYVAFRHVIFKFQHQRAIRKNVVRRQLQKSEYYWGILRTVEAGLESCGQLILQVWLLSSDFKKLNDKTFPQLADMTYNGVIFFLTFSYKPATEIEKSLGKLFMSVIALVLGVSACYRTLKRGSVNITNQLFIYFSLFLQIFARLFSITLFFFAVRHFIPALPLMLLIHIFLVLILKFTMERTVYSKGMAANLVALVNVVASTIVYVRIVPIEKSRVEAINNGSGGGPPLTHSTCFIQTLFFTLIVIENLILSCWPLLSNGGHNRAVACLGEEKIYEYVALVLMLTVAGWICHVIYYCTGHPWADINGPTFRKNPRSIHVPVFHCGTESVLSCGFRQVNTESDNNSDNETEEGTAVGPKSTIFIHFRANNHSARYHNVLTAV